MALGFVMVKRTVLTEVMRAHVEQKVKLTLYDKIIIEYVTNYVCDYLQLCT